MFYFIWLRGRRWQNGLDYPPAFIFLFLLLLI
jgi:hypothetical protein